MSSDAPLHSRQPAIARYLERTRAERALMRDNIPARPPGADVEASDPQQQIWLHAQIAGDTLAYNEPVTLRYEGDLNVSAVERGFNEIIRRHDAWRTVFEWRQNKLWQSVIPDFSIRIPMVDLRGERADRREQRAVELAAQDWGIPFDLTKLPLFRARLVRLADRDFRLYLTLHHIIFDGVSLYQVLLPELEICYAAFSMNRESSLEPVPVQYPDYCLYRQSHLGSQDTSIRYWEQRIGGELPELPLPLDRPRPPVRSFVGAMDPFTVSREIAQQVRAVGQLNGATSYMTYLAAFHLLLYHFTGQSDQVVGTVSSGRQHEQTERILGCFLNTVVLRVIIRPEASFVDLLMRVREATLEALIHELPFTMLLGRFAKHRTPGVSPLFQVMFTFEPPLLHAESDWRLSHMDVNTGTSKYDLHLELDDRQQGLTGRFMYPLDVFDASTIAGLKRKWTALLGLIATQPHTIVADLSRALNESGAGRPPITQGESEKRRAKLFWQFVRGRESAHG